MSDQVLVVDDEQGVRTSLRRALEEEGFSVRTVSSGRAALQQTEEAEPDVAVVDLKLGDTSGLDVLRDIKQRSPRTVTIRISAYGDVSDVVSAMKRGAEDYVQKPYDLDEMVLFSSITGNYTPAAFKREVDQ